MATLHPGRALGWILAAVVTGGGMSCVSQIKQSRELEVKGLAVDKLWAICVEAVNAQFRIDPSRVDLGRRTMTTRWRTDARAFGAGRRRRAFLEITENAPKDHVVKFYVELQRYGEMSSALNPVEEEWEAAGQDGALERRLYRHLTIRVDQALGVKPRSPGNIQIEDPLRRR